MNIPRPPPRPVNTRLKNALLVVLNDRSGAVARLFTNLQAATVIRGCSTSVSMLLNPIDTAPVFALNDILEIPVPLLFVNVELQIKILAQLKISKTASEKFLFGQNYKEVDHESFGNGIKCASTSNHVTIESLLPFMINRLCYYYVYNRACSYRIENL